nr:MAG TPA: Helicase REPLICATION [Caudoviricetes sp.]
MAQVEALIALLRDKPVDVDFELFQPDREAKFVAKYFDDYGQLPTENVFLSEMGLDRVGDVGPWAFYENKLKGDKFIREALPVLTRFNNEYESGQKEALLNLRERLISLAEPTERLAPVSIIKDTGRYARFKDVDNTRIPTGIKPLDEACGGLSVKDEFMIISARLGIGKSWIAHAMAQSMTVAGYRVGIYSGEMSEDEVGARFDALLSHISNYALTRGKEVDLTDHMQKLAEVQGDCFVLTPAQIHHNARPSDLRKFVKECKLDCLFIDQLDLMEPDGSRGGQPEFEQKALLSYQLKSLQQELRIPIVAVSQLNRAAAQQEADASNIAGSDRIGRDATLIIALKRSDETLKIKVLKARSFRIPDQPWEFTWDIDKGILEPKLSSMDAVRAKVKQAKAKQKVVDDNAVEEVNTPVGDDEIW